MRSPAHQPLHPIEPPPQLTLRLHNLSLQHGKLHNALTILRPNSRKPNTLRRLFRPLSLHFVPTHLTLFVLLDRSITPSVHHYIRTEFVAAHMADEEDPTAPRPLVVSVAV